MSHSLQATTGESLTAARQRPAPGRAPGKTRVLVVEDERDIADLIKHTLERGGDIDVQIVASGDAALKTSAELPPELILLDLNLPVVNGLEVCRLLRSRPATKSVPIIMLTARSTEAARVRAVLRRGRPDAPQAPVVYRGEHLVADFEAVNIEVDGEAIRLTRREFELLRYLVENRNRVLSRDRLLERVWGYDRLIETRSVDVHVGRLRSKLGPAGRQIETVVGLGYRFVEEKEK
jgi:two-component system, OmpR family, phosphate regulon response regulator PhoB